MHPYGLQMSNDKPALTAETVWSERVYELQKTDPVEGGADGIDNLPLNQLTARTNYLRVMGIGAWAAVFNYPIGAFCQVSGVVYRATVANTGKPPVSNPSIWTACPMTAAEISAALNFVTALNGKQDADNTLTALANLATSADKLIYATGADQFALTPLTAFIRSLLDDADAASARATLGAAADNHGHATSQITGLDGALGDRYTKAEANNLLAAKINKAGDTMTGKLTFKGGTLEAGGGFNSAADNDSGMDFPADGHVRLRSNARVAVEALSDGSVKTWYGGNNLACQSDGNMVVYDTTSAAKHVIRGNGSYTATGNIESQASIYGREVIAKQTAIICNRTNESQQWHLYSDDDWDVNFWSNVSQKIAMKVNREGAIQTAQYGWLHDKFAPLVSPALTGTPTAPTAAIGTRSTQIANTAFVGAECQIAAPVGSVYTFAGATVPTGWLKCNGALLSRTTYAALFAVIGTTYGAGDGSTTFALPDLRGEFVRGADDGRGVDAGRVFGSAQSDAVQEWTATMTLQRAQIYGTEVIGGAISIGASGVGCVVGSAASGATWGTGVMTIGPGVNSTARTAAESRPRNVAMHYIIKF